MDAGIDVRFSSCGVTIRPPRREPDAADGAEVFVVVRCSDGGGGGGGGGGGRGLWVRCWVGGGLVL